MKSGKNLPLIEETFEEIDAKNTLSIDEFFKQLEAKEKDLDISTEMVIEIDQSDSNEEDVRESLKSEPFAVREEKSAEMVSEQKLDRQEKSELDNKVSMLQKQISKMENERGALIEIARRRQTDFENYKKRVERDKNDVFFNQIVNLATQMLPVLDNFNRALDSVSNLKGDRVLDSEQFFNGIILVNQQLNEVLSDMGVSPIASVGEHFDPHLHEAVATEEAIEVPPHTITAELRRGYRIGERVIRHSMVKVSEKRTS